MNIARIFDTETTGKNEPQLIEAAWLQLADIAEPSVAESFCQRYTPSKPIELGAMATHHITMEDLEGCPSNTTFALPETDYLIGHNVEYDWGVAGQPEVKLVDTLGLARVAWPGLDSYSQSALLYHLLGAAAREQLRNAHSALADVYICRQILLHLLEILKPASWEQLHEASEHALTPTVMPFGKHQGVPLKQVPRDYVAWLLKQDNVNPRLRKALTA